MKNRLKFVLLVLVSVLVWNYDSMIGNAAGEKTYFGSVTYEWKLEERSPIGVYISSDETIDDCEMVVNYDPQVLEYHSGGELIEEGTIFISKQNVNAKEVKEMLQFVPLMATDTAVTVSEAYVMGEGDNKVKATDSQVMVKIPIPDSAKLSDIKVQGTTIDGFAEDNTSYQIEVDHTVERLEITTEPGNENTTVAVSDTNLKEGENTITIVTTDAAEQSAKYMLLVTRKEAPAVEDSKQDEVVTETVAVEEKTSEDVMVDVKKIAPGAVVVIVFVVLIISLLLLFIREIRVYRWEKKRRKRMALKRKQNQRLYLGRSQTQAPERTKVDSNDIEQEKKREEISQDIPVVDAKQDSKKDKFEDLDSEIVVDHVTMEFKREKDEATSIKELLIRTLKRQRSYEMFRALDDVSFRIKKGEVVGIIGTNGSGKSTILKIISGVLAPTRGRVDVDKRKIQLLTLGTGFDFELTGRENVYLNGAIIGYTKEFIDEKYDEIVQFAELEGFMEEKVRNYSSGMVSRLGFAIATVRDTPEILILDEVLSVGDMFFRKKSEAKIKEMIHGGSTVLIVSHSTSVIRNNCTKAVWIEKGKMRAIGDPKEVCDAYEKMNE